MFKCTECGTEYDIKPDYCDCGNDNFEQIKEKTLPKQEPQPEIHKPTPKIEIKQVKPQTPKKKPQTFDIISLFIFAVCVLLSLVIIFFVGNPKEQVASKEKKETIPQNQNIPSSVNSFWNNSTEGVISDSSLNSPKIVQTQKQQPVQQEQTKPIIQKQIIYVHDAPSTPAPVKTQHAKQVKQTIVTPKTIQTQTKTAQAKTNSTPKTSTSSNVQNMPQAPSYANSLTNKIKQNVTSQMTKPSQPVQTRQTQTQPVQNIQTVKPQQTTAQTTNKPSVLAPSPSSVSKVDSAAAKQELANYKVSLRNTIGKKIDFTKVVGDGDCAVTFKIASNGKLTNRAFSKQSSNITLNDAVYAAMMSTPSFNAPPSAYNNETLKLSVKFYNGNFTINLN